MIHIFLSIYRFFRNKKALLFGLLILMTGWMAYLSFRVRLVEDINSFMPGTEDTKYIGEVFENIRIKDKIVILISSRDSVLIEPEQLITVCDAFFDSLRADEIYQTHVDKIFYKVDESLADQAYDYITGHLPIFLDSADYNHLDTLLLEENLDRKIRQNYTNLMSPLSLVTRKYMQADPLGLSGESLKKFSNLQLNLQYDIYDDHILSTDHRYLLAFISPRFGAGKISDNEPFVKEIEERIAQFSSQYPQVKVSYFGGIPISVYNARQIKSDAWVSMIISLAIIVVVVLLAFRKKSSIPLIVLPVIFGGLFSLAVLSVIRGDISTIAIGAGSAIMGIAFSYSIHVFCHSFHARSAEQVIRELVYPLTIGSFTTIGAFAGLTFSNSRVLQDFGWFACFALIGTTLFCLIFLPHMLDFRPAKEGVLMKWIEKWNAYPLEKNKWVLGFLCLLIVVCLFFYNDVKFNPDMMSLSYMPDKFAEAESTLDEILQDEARPVYFVSVGSNTDEALGNYKKTNEVLDRLKSEKLIDEYSSACDLLISPGEQMRRIRLWNEYWTPERKSRVKQDLVGTGARYNFKPSAFQPFFETLDRSYQPVDYENASFSGNSLLGDWFDHFPGLDMAISQVRLKTDNKAEVYNAFSSLGNTVILDKPYFVQKMAHIVNDDFNMILYIVSILVFLSILVSYGRIEITLITFLPMAISWVIILGLMALLNIEFNIINIIISTFIFGIGDDFSIFITDGLLSEYKNGQKMLNAHKTSIFFSALTVITGLGAMLFSRHPALYSVSVTSVIGMFAVVLVAYSIQPFIFRLLISDRTSRGKFPHTWYSIFATFVAMNIFITGCTVLTILSYLLILIPISEKKKKKWFHNVLHRLSAFLLKIMANEKKLLLNPFKEDFKKPAIIIANHQSVIDIIQILALHHRIIMVTKSWVTNSPLFGRVAEYAGFISVSNGYEQAEAKIREQLQEGFSIVIFPEGSRSDDCNLRRFHKGAFYLADQLKADILPILLYGQGQVISKNDWLYVKDGILSAKILNRITYPDSCSYGATYQEKCKGISRIFKEEYVAFRNEVDQSNPYYRYKLIKNYTYKGPVLEWYLRVKVAMEKDYVYFDRMIPQSAKITDLGCGYGFLDYMLAFKSPERIITGIDYDEDKVGVAQHNFSRNEQLNFQAADISCIDPGYSDVFVLNDVLHYLPKEKQDLVLARCVSKLNKDGMIIIRDGASDKGRKHALTRLTEVFSTKIFHFNRKENELRFISMEEIAIFAQDNGLSLSMSDNDRLSSNTIFILKKNREIND